jgi:hypothetical protein
MSKENKFEWTDAKVLYLVNTIVSRTLREAKIEKHNFFGGYSIVSEMNASKITDLVKDYKNSHLYDTI